MYDHVQVWNFDAGGWQDIDPNMDGSTPLKNSGATTAQDKEAKAVTGSGARKNDAHGSGTHGTKFLSKGFESALFVMAESFLKRP